MSNRKTLTTSPAAIAGGEVFLREGWHTVQVAILQLWYSYALLYLAGVGIALVAIGVAKRKGHRVSRFVFLIGGVLFTLSLLYAAYVLAFGGNYAPNDALNRIDQRFYETGESNPGERPLPDNRRPMNDALVIPPQIYVRLFAERILDSRGETQVTPYFRLSAGLGSACETTGDASITANVVSSNEEVRIDIRSPGTYQLWGLCAVGLSARVEVPIEDDWIAEGKEPRIIFVREGKENVYTLKKEGDDLIKVTLTAISTENVTAEDRYDNASSRENEVAIYLNLPEYNRKWQDAALETGEWEHCNNVVEASSISSLHEDCVRAVVLEHLDPSICEETDALQRNLCLWDIINENEEVAVCERMPNDHLYFCFLNLARNLEDPELCLLLDSIGSSQVKNCVNSYVQTNPDATACDKVLGADSESLELCYFYASEEQTI